MTIPNLASEANLLPVQFVEAMHGLVGNGMIEVNEPLALSDLEGFVATIDKQTSPAGQKELFVDYVSQPNSSLQKAQVTISDRGRFSL